MNKNQILDIIATVAILLFFVIVFVAIIKNIPEKVDEKIIDSRHTDAYVGIVTDYKYEYDIFSEEGFKKVPNTHSQQFPEKWELQYEIKYDNGTTKTEWREVTKQEYEDFLNGGVR